MTDAARPEYGEYAPSATPPVRPARPEYGEYATPAQVAEAMGTAEPHPDAPPAVVPEHTRAPGRPQTSAPEPEPSSSLSAAAPESLRAPDAAERVAGRAPTPAWDRPITVGLLTAGVLNLILSTPAFLSFAEVMTQAVKSTPDPAVYAAVSFGSAANTAGVALLVIQTLILIASILVSVRQLRRGRRAFWVPIAGALLSGVALVAVAAIILAVSSTSS